MKRADVNRLMWEQFPNCTVDKITNNGNATIVHITTENGSHAIAEIRQYMGIPFVNTVFD